MKISVYAMAQVIKVPRWLEKMLQRGYAAKPANKLSQSLRPLQAYPNPKTTAGDRWYNRR
jgi:hypothetical protein